jgi:hypothetical protein
VPANMRSRFCGVLWRCLRYLLFTCMNQAGTDRMKDFLLYLNQVGLCTEEISEAGEACVKSHFVFLYRLNSFEGLEMPSRGSRTFSYIQRFKFLTFRVDMSLLFRQHIIFQEPWKTSDPSRYVYFKLKVFTRSKLCTDLLVK